MYLNVLSFKNGKSVAFQTKTPYSVDKVAPEWNIVTDELNGQSISFRGSEIVTIASAPVEDAKPAKKPRVVTKVTSE